MATYRATGQGGGTSGTSDRSTAYTPAVGDLLVVFVNVSDNANTTPTMSDSQGGTYTRIGHAAWGSSAHSMSAFVRDQIVTSAVAHTITAATGSNSAGQIIISSISGMFRAGSSAIRSFGKQENQATSTTPAPALNQNALTNNLTLAAVASGDTTTSPNASWTERFDTSQSTPTTALEVSSRNSGFTGTTITHGATQSTDFASMAIELDGSAEDIPSAAIASATIANPTITIGGLTRTPSAAVASATIANPTYEYESGDERTPAAAVATATATNPSLTIGGVGASPGAANGLATASNPTLTIGGVTVTPSPAVATSSAANPDFTIGGLSRVPAAGIAEASAANPTATNVSTLGAAVATATASNPTLTIGPVTVTPMAAEAAATAANVIRDVQFVVTGSGSITSMVSSAGSRADTATSSGSRTTSITLRGQG